MCRSRVAVAMVCAAVWAAGARPAAQRALVSVFGTVGPPASAIVDIPYGRVTPFSSELLDYFQRTAGLRALPCRWDTAAAQGAH